MKTEVFTPYASGEVTSPLPEGATDRSAELGEAVCGGHNSKRGVAKATRGLFHAAFPAMGAIDYLPELGEAVCGALRQGRHLP